MPTAPRPNIEAVLLHMLGQKGDRYIFGAETTPAQANPTAFDCSELVQWACARAGVQAPDGAANQWAWVQHAGLAIPVEKALKTRGALMFPFPDVHHVVASLGDGTTIEAKGAKWGVGVFSAKGRFQRAGLIPGVDYSKAPLLEPVFAVGEPHAGRVAKLTLAGGRGGYFLHADGGVFTWGTARFYGSYPGLPAAGRQGGPRTFTKIAAYQGGYVLTSSKGETYHFPAPKA